MTSRASHAPPARWRKFAASSSANPTDNPPAPRSGPARRSNRSRRMRSAARDDLQRGAVAHAVDPGVAHLQVVIEQDEIGALTGGDAAHVAQRKEIGRIGA